MQAYPKFGIRKVVLLDGFWDFKFIPEVGRNEVEVDRVEFDDVMCVPGSFDAMPKYLNCRGVGCYRRSISIEQTGRQELKFYGLGFSANIYINGQLVGKNDLTYSPFTVEFQAPKAGTYELIVITDNRYDETTSPLMIHYYDFFGYGGIYRSVELHSLPECALQRVEVRMKNVYNGEITLSIRLTGEIPRQLQCQISFDGGNAQSYTLDVNDQAAILDCRVPNCKLWSVETPNLHTVSVRLKDDLITERFGLRELKAKNGQILLNNIPQKLRGYCRHESHIEFGVSLPPAVMLEDLQNLKMMGCNFIRGVHYPQDAAFWDLCDQLGLIVWSETLGWGNNETQFNNPLFKSAQLRQAENMIFNDINHPSIAFWGFLNEGLSNVESNKHVYRDISSLLRSANDGRLITYASFTYEQDCCFEFADVVSINAYPAWYLADELDMHPTAEIPLFFDKFIEFLNQSPFKDKPLIISEVGAGAIPGWHDRARRHWSEEYQLDYLETVVEYFAERSRVAGLSLWHYADCRTYGGKRALTRPRSLNNKGTFDEYRRPKLAYEAVKKVFTELADKEK